MPYAKGEKWRDGAEPIAIQIISLDMFSKWMPGYDTDAVVQSRGGYRH
jgi:hypothetical protein